MVIWLIRQKLELDGAATVAGVAREWIPGAVKVSMIHACLECHLEHVLQHLNSVERDLGSGHLEERDAAALEGPRASRAESRNSMCAWAWGVLQLVALLGKADQRLWSYLEV